MAIDPVLTSTATLEAGPRSRQAERSREAGAERLGKLVRTMEQVAEQIDAPGRSESGQIVLRARFNDLQRQVNRLDGIVAGEGLEASGQEAVVRAAETGGNATAAAPSVDNGASGPSPTTAAQERGSNPAVEARPSVDPSGIDITA
jgi:hypothetical protein